MFDNNQDVPPEMYSSRQLVRGFLFTLLCSAGPAFAMEAAMGDWYKKYGANSNSGRNAGCQLCHVSSAGGTPWNA